MMYYPKEQVIGERMARVSDGPVVFFKAISCDHFLTRGTVILWSTVHRDTKLGFLTVQV